MNKKKAIGAALALSLMAAGTAVVFWPDPEDTPRAPNIWVPEPEASWHWQLEGPLDMEVDAEVYGVDLFDITEAQIEALHDSGVRVWCYLNAGAYEDWRPDKHLFPAIVLGDRLDPEWVGERWLDIRRRDLLLPIMAQRMRLCAEKGFDAVEVDNIDGYDNKSGFPLMAGDQARYNIALATLAHINGLSIGFKNDLGQAADLEPYFDFAVVEECLKYNECGQLRPFTDARKAVFHVEYEQSIDTICATTEGLGFTSIKKRMTAVDAWFEGCP